jgi:hypothetical protein
MAAAGGPGLTTRRSFGRFHVTARIQALAPLLAIRIQGGGESLQDYGVLWLEGGVGGGVSW